MRLVWPWFFLLVSCLDPLVSDEVEHPELILPAGTEPPALADDPAARAALDRADGVEETVIPLRSAFGGGEHLLYWDFGPASPSPIPLYMLVQATEQGIFDTPDGKFSPVPGHPPIFDAIPGDPGYSPWWRVVLVPVTDAYHGEVLASFAAVDEAFRQGLVGASITLPRALNCPVVLPEARLETEPGDAATVEEPRRAFYKGKTVHYFSFAAIDVATLAVPTPPLYVLSREGGEPLSEPLRGVDMTADGDRLDSNDLFSATPEIGDYSGMVSLVDAVVTDGDYIDRSGSDEVSALMDAAALFTGDQPDPARVVALHPEGVVVNRPIQAESYDAEEP